MNRRTLLTTATAAGALFTLGACAQKAQGNDIVDIASGNPNFSTLVAALSAAGLVETLRGDGPFTVFAPTNAAFDALPAGTVDTLLQPENVDQLRSILTYHVVPGAYQSSDLLGQRLDVATVNGKTLRVDATGGKYETTVRVNDANVINADILASNGVIHVIDKVLMP